MNIPVNNCCGCTACYNACPSSAIQMISDNEGFYYPTVDTNKCCECSVCERVCPINNPPRISDSFADCIIAQHKDRCVLDESTSGGFVDALCEYVTEKCNGYVVGVCYDAEFLPVHKLVKTYEEAKAFRNSKYAQSYLGDIFTQLRDLLDNKETVMFVGTPCQVAGLKAFLRKDYEKLITVDMVCRSIPSPKLWREYLKWQENRYQSKVKNVVCRKKTYGYHSGTLQIKFKNGKIYNGSNRVDCFMKAFHSDICSMPSCYECHFKTRHRCSDFTVFDCWRPNKVKADIIDNDYGFSNVLVHTDKGKVLLPNLNKVCLYHVDPEELLEVMGSMITKSIEQKNARKIFYSTLNKNGFIKTTKKFCNPTITDKLIETAKPIVYYRKKRH